MDIFPRDAVCYWDLEGVLFGESLVKIGQEYGCEDEMLKITNAGMNGEIPFQQSMATRLDILRRSGITLDKIITAARDVDIETGAHNTLKETANFFTNIALTGGLDVIVLEILRYRQLIQYFDRVYASIYFGGNKIQPDKIKPLVEKGEIIKDELNLYRYKHSAFVFDGVGDARAAKSVNLQIAYNPKPEAARIVAEYENGQIIRNVNNLNIILPIIMRCRDA